MKLFISHRTGYGFDRVKTLFTPLRYAACSKFKVKLVVSNRKGYFLTLCILRVIEHSISQGETNMWSSRQLEDSDLCCGNQLATVSL